MKINCRHIIFLLGSVAALSVNGTENFTVGSPDNMLCVEVTVADDNGLYYSVTHNGTVVIKPSRLGVSFGTASLSEFPNGAESSLATIDETYTLPHGKQSVYRNHCNELTVVAKGSHAVRNLTVCFRVYNDAVAFRYEFSNREGNTLTSELTEFNIASFSTSWAQPYRADYSWYYEPRTWDEMTTEQAYNVPVLVDASNCYILLTESASFASMGASRVVTGSENGQLKLALGGGSIIGSSSFQSPWRTLLIGSLPQIVESSTVTNLNPATEMDDIEWVKPGRCSWNWGAEDGDSAPTADQARRYIDFASLMGWEYFLLDDGWDGRIDIAEISQYAEDKGVGLMLWSHQNRFSNSQSEIDRIFGEWKNTGTNIKGVKIDFFEDDSREMLEKYENILKAAANHQMLVNFHGCTKPSGLQRYWPHLMTMEGVLGGEFYMFNSTMTPGTHTVNLALTRNVLGSMDYTPVKFGNKRGRVITNTTWAYQLALAVAFESSLQHICDTPENVVNSIAEPLLRMLPVAWDETKCLEAKPDSYVTLARRKGSDWWVATLTSESRSLSVNFSFLDSGKKYYAHVYSEGFHRSDIDYKCLEVTASDCVDIEIGENSGASIILTENPQLLHPETIKFEAEKYNRYCDRVSDAYCSGGAYLTNISGSRRMVKFTDVEVPAAGDYALTLFYLSDADRDAYVCVNDGEKLYHSFASQGAVSGQYIGFKTIIVTLDKGVNTIAIGNENDVAPSFDRAVLTWFSTSGSASTEKVEINNCLEPEVEAKDGGLVVEALSTSVVKVYDLSGRVISSGRIPAGENFIPVEAKGPVLVNVSSASLSHTVKLIVK